MVYYQEAMWHVEKLVHYLLCQSHSEGLYNQKITIFTITTGPFATKFLMIVQHHKPECPVEKWVYCIQGQGHSKG